MYTQNPPANRLLTPIVFFIALFLLIILIWRPFVIPKDEASGKQLQLPFKDFEESKKPEPKDPKVAPYPYAKRYDENRLGTCIIYALTAPRSGYYLIPGCYGKPDYWQDVDHGQILKIGRHWNQSIPSCASTDKLIRAVLNKRYKFDKKFPKGFISVKIGEDVVPTQLNVFIMDCVEETTEADCEVLEKQYISSSRGPKKLL